MGWQVRKAPEHLALGSGTFYMGVSHDSEDDSVTPGLTVLHAGPSRLVGIFPLVYLKTLVSMFAEDGSKQ